MHKLIIGLMVIQPADTGMARRNEDIYRCYRNRAGFHTICCFSARRVIPAPRQPDTARAYTLRRPSGRRFYLGIKIHPDLLAAPSLGMA
jgi:hypothetical protein